jgi:hypothetical protein
MSQIPEVYIKTYSANLLTLSQQLGSKLRNAVRLERKGGESAFFDTVGSVTAADKTARYPNTPLIETPFGRRMVPLKQKDIADLVDNVDKIKSAITPESHIVRAQAYALGRGIDSWVIDAALGDAMGGVDGTTTIPFDPNQVVPIDLGGANEGITINNLIEAKKLFWNNDVDLEDPMNELYMAVSGEQLANLLATTEVTSADYNTVKALVQGQVDSFMGFKFIQTQLLGADSPTETRSCFAWAKQGIVLNLPEDITGSIDIRPDLSLGIQMYARASGNAVRKDEKLVLSLP